MTNPSLVTSSLILNQIGSHSELLEDPEGAYSQLIQLQDLNKCSEKQENGSKEEGPEISVASGRHSSQRVSMLTSPIQESCNSSNTGRHSISTISVSEELRLDNQKDSAPSNVSLLRLAYLNKPEILVILLGSVAAAINGAILPIYGYLLSIIIKTFFKPAHELRKDSQLWALMLVVLGLASLVATPLRTYFFGVAGCKLVRRIRLKCFEKVLQMEISWFDKTENSSGLIGAKLSSDAASVRGLVGDNLSLLVQNTATALTGLIIGFMGDWQLALIVLLLIPLIGLNGYLHMRFVSGFSADTKVIFTFHFLLKTN